MEQIIQEEITPYQEAKLAVAKAADCPVSIVTSVAAGMHRGTDLCHLLAMNAGWWKDKDPHNPETFATKIALIHSEVSEAMEGGRKGLPDSHLPHYSAEEVELADAMIRIFDLAGSRNLNLAGALVEKLAYNLSRADHKPEARQGIGGKQF